jgi:hypothetical protein
MYRDRRANLYGLAHTRFATPWRLKSDEGQWWKERYLLWLRPRLNQYSKAPPCTAGSYHQVLHDTHQYVDGHG